MRRKGPAVPSSKEEKAEEGSVCDKVSRVSGMCTRQYFEGIFALYFFDFFLKIS